MRKFCVLPLIVSLALCLSFLSCGKQEQEATQQEGVKKIQIAVIPKGTTHEFWKTIHAGAVKASRELEVDIIWKGPQKEDDRAQQIMVVEDFINRGVDGIVLAPLDDRALCRPVQDAVRETIPVVIIDSELQGEDFVSFVATDNYKGGVIAARKLGELLGGKGEIFLIRYQEGSASTTKRENGFLDTITSEFPDVSLLVQDQHTGATTETAYQLAENLIGRFPEVEGIFCPNESSTFGTLRALQESGLAGKIKFVGFDSSPKLIQALRDGHIHGLVLQNPMKMGYLGVKQMVLHLRGQSIESRVDTGVYLATRENMDDTEMKNLLEPDFAAYLDR
ncbi:MAG: substrate-binding domain-containing protein [Candidatus Aminicenantes bacterium]|nr:substrate-binding domain-containing protein [Candidatus Aminicenantes bacterium]